MMNKYILMKSPATGDTVSIFDRERELVIPLSLSNADYGAYLEWVNEGNEPDTPEEVNGHAAE